MYANSKSVLNEPGGYRGESIGGFKYDPIKYHVQNKRSKEPNSDHAAAYEFWKNTKADESGKTIAGLQTLDVFVNAGTAAKQKQIARLANTAHLLAKRSLSLDVFEDLITVQLQNGCDMGCQYYSHQSLKELLCIMATDEKDANAQTLKNVRFVSIIADGSNDKGIVEQEAVT
jgi:hypothetical protein